MAFGTGDSGLIATMTVSRYVAHSSIYSGTGSGSTTY